MSPVRFAYVFSFANKGALLAGLRERRTFDPSLARPANNSKTHSPRPRFDHQGRNRPPSMCRTVPVMNDEAGSVRKSTARAISADVARRPRGSFFAASARASSVMNFRSPGVSVQPG